METISIKDILRLFLAKIWLIIIMLIVGAGVAFSYSKFVMPLQYESYTTMYVKNNNQSQPTVNVNDLNTAKSLVSTYIAVLKSDTIMEDVSKKLINEYGEKKVSESFTVTNGVVSPNSLRSCLTMTAVDQTEVMKISAVTNDAEMSAALCKAIADLAPDFLIRVVGAGSVETIDEAQIKSAPVSPNITKNTLLGGLVGAVLACAIIFLIDFFDNTVKESEHLSSKYKKPILGEIYAIDVDRKRKSDLGNHYLITDEKTPFYVIESYKAMRTNLIFSLSTSEKKIFAVSSALPSEGKSTTAANIAIALSQLNANKVLLIDGDMRKPVQHKIFKLKNKNGLSAILGKMSSIEDCIQKSVMNNLDVITAGEQPPNPAELLSSEQMEKLLAELSEKYDYIVIDMPPVNVVSDPLAVSRLISGLMVVVKYGKTSFDDIEEVMKKSELSDMKLLGFAVTRIQRKNGGNSYYSKKYRYDYSYGNPAEKSDHNEN